MREYCKDLQATQLETVCQDEETAYRWTDSWSANNFTCCIVIPYRMRGSLSNLQDTGLGLCLNVLHALVLCKVLRISEVCELLALVLSSVPKLTSNKLTIPMSVSLLLYFILSFPFTNISISPTYVRGVLIST